MLFRGSRFPAHLAQLLCCLCAIALSLGACFSVPPCGGVGQACCMMGAECRPGALCYGGCTNICVHCGSTGEACCQPGDSCDPGLACDSGGWFSGRTCTHCGNSGEPCCTGSSCSAGLACRTSTVSGMPICAACGGVGQPCCAGISCGVDSVCIAGACAACGAEGTPCCAGATCSGTLSCNGGTCGVCGSTGFPCCASGCNDGSQCVAGRCAGCGLFGEPCCESGLCRMGLTCDRTRHCGVCGSAGLPCCAGDRCAAPASCVAGSCVNPGISCSDRACSIAGETCVPFASAQCQRSCSATGDCDAQQTCLGGTCTSGCASGDSSCDSFGGACFVGIVPFTAIAPPVSATGQGCVPSCVTTGSAPSAVPLCAAGTVCDPSTGGCIASPQTVDVGAPCSADTDCGGSNTRCFRAIDDGGHATGFVGGYCTALARMPISSDFPPGLPLPSSNCPAGSAVVPMPESRVGDAVACYRVCSNDCDCREGYRCDHDPRQTGIRAPTGVCLPIDCSATGAACPGGAGCFVAGVVTRHAVCGVADLDAGYIASQRNTGCDAGDAGVSEDGGIDASDAMDATSNE